jgi:hypothetical protein
MKSKIAQVRRISAVAVLCLFLIPFAGQMLAQTASMKAAESASPELISELTKALSVTPSQASGGAGALFGLAKSRLAPADFTKVAAAVPGIDSLIKSAPAASGSKGIPGLSGVSGALPAELGGLASVAGSFKKLGLSPDMAAKFVPVLTKFVESKGGSSVSSLLAGALK